LPQAARRYHRPGAAAPLPPRQHGRAAALHRANAGAAADPRSDALEARRDAGAVDAALCPHLGVRSSFHLLSERRLGVQSDGLAIAVRVRRLVRARWRKSPVAHHGRSRHAVGLGGLPRVRVLRDADLVRAGDEPLAAAPARTMDVPDRKDRPRRAALCALPRAGGDHPALPAARLASFEIALAEALDPVRTAFAGDLLPRRLPRLCRTFYP